MRDIALYEQILGLPKPWRVTDVKLRDDEQEVIVHVGLSRPLELTCPECGERMTGYDHRRRRWRHLDTCQYKTIIEADVPRGECATHGVRQVDVPWAEERSRFTALFEALAIDWLRETSQSAVARRLKLTWAEVHGIMERAVERGLARREKEPIPFLGVDETSFQKRHEYVTVVNDLTGQRVLYVADGRGKGSLDGFWDTLTDEQLEAIEGIAMDMWDPYVISTLEHVPDASNKIVYDKFHVVAHLIKAIDTVRKQEHRSLMRQGDDSLKGTKYLWLMNEERFDEDGWLDFQELRESNLKTARARAIADTFRHFWSYTYLASARKFFDQWYGWAIRSRLEPIKKVARMLKKRLDNILTYLKHRITNAAAEGLNAKIQWIKYTARGYANRENFRIAILFHCGGLGLYPHGI
jgi:transposase